MDASAPIAEFRAAGKRFGEVTALEGMTLSVARGEFLSFLGPSGCGKTTALRLLAGFEEPDGGEVVIDGARVNGVPAHLRPVNMVFQHYALFPHMTVADNIAYGLRQRRPRPAEAEVARAVEEALETVRLAGFGARRTWQLSGGQQQRVALARAIINRPRLLLLDEPMAALDRKLRRDVQLELLALQRKLGITFIIVTHDQEEALTLSDRIVLMRAGRIVQVGAPGDLYDRPASRYVADFVGKSNFLPGKVMMATGDHAVLETSGGPLPGRLTRPLAPGSAAVASLRPEAIRLAAEPGPGSREVRVETRLFLGEHCEYLLQDERLGPLLARVPREAEAEGGFAPGATLHAAWRDDAVLILSDD